MRAFPHLLLWSTKGFTEKTLPGATFLCSHHVAWVKHLWVSYLYHFFLLRSAFTLRWPTHCNAIQYIFLCLYCREHVAAIFVAYIEWKKEKSLHPGRDKGQAFLCGMTAAVSWKYTCCRLTGRHNNKPLFSFFPLFFNLCWSRHVIIWPKGSGAAPRCKCGWPGGSDCSRKKSFWWTEIMLEVQLVLEKLGPGHIRAVILDFACRDMKVFLS